MKVKIFTDSLTICSTVVCVGFEFDSYNATEEEGSVTGCILIENNQILGSREVVTVIVSSTDGSAGKYVVWYTQSWKTLTDKNHYFLLYKLRTYIPIVHLRWYEVVLQTVLKLMQYMFIVPLAEIVTFYIMHMLSLRWRRLPICSYSRARYHSKHAGPDLCKCDDF